MKDKTGRPLPVEPCAVDVSCTRNCHIEYEEACPRVSDTVDVASGLCCLVDGQEYSVSQ